MKIDRSIRSILVVIAFLLLLNLAYRMFSGHTVQAQQEGITIGRYQIGTWGAQMGPGYTRHGYYIIDTATGKVVDHKSETYKSQF
jgi:hypothetical protein